MNEHDLTTLERHLAVTESIEQITPAQAEQIVRAFLERAAGSPNDWDNRFLEFIHAAQAGRILAASAGDGIRVIFSPDTKKGIWLMDRPTLRGKGLLSPVDVERLSGVAARVRPPPP